MLKQIDFEKTPVVEAVNDILVDASKRGASDVHFDPLEEHMKVRIRVDGQLHDYVLVPNSIKKNLITRIKIISGMNITESRLPQDGAIKATIKDINLDLRVSSIPTIEGEKIVIRLLDYSMSNSGLESLGFNDRNLKKVIQMINVPNGIILITGATGSGKSTTVYSILHRLNKEETNIITVEDPIEMNITGINQIQTNSEIGLDFATALRSILRQDPNIIMIGEIRDTETAKIAVRASITGHLVLSTIHTNDSLNTIERLLDMDVERYLLSSALTGIISQKLARKLCTKCRTKRPTNQYEKDIFKKVLGRDVEEVYCTNGCDECGNGYSGRIAIHEVLTINQDIKDAISENIRKEALRELVYNSDVITLLQDGLEKVANGLTTFEELLKIIELEDDEKLANTYSLKTALDYTEIVNNNIEEEDEDEDEENKTEDNIIHNSNDSTFVSTSETFNNVDANNTVNDFSADNNIEINTNYSDDNNEENTINFNNNINETNISSQNENVNVNVNSYDDSFNINNNLPNNFDVSNSLNNFDNVSITSNLSKEESNTNSQNIVVENSINNSYENNNIMSSNNNDINNTVSAPEVKNTNAENEIKEQPKRNFGNISDILNKIKK